MSVTVSESDQRIRPGDIVIAYDPDGYLVKVYGFEGGGSDDMIWVNGDHVRIPLGAIHKPTNNKITRLRLEFEVLGF